MAMMLLCGMPLALTVAAPIDIGDRRQLFLDGKFIAESEGFRREMHPAQKQGLAITQTLGSEEGRIGPYGAVGREGDQLLMWYWCTEPRLISKGRNSLGFATSTDGFTWAKPTLNLVERMGTTDNNVVPAMGDTVAPMPPGSDDKWVMLKQGFWPDPDKAGLFLAFSKDGIHWRSDGTRVFPFVPDTQNQVRWDSRLGKWVAYLRKWDPDRRVGRLEIDNLTEPWPYNHDAEPRHIWGKDKIPVPQDELPTVMATDELDPPDCDVYTPVVVEYPWADDAYFMFPNLYQHFPDKKHGGEYDNDGILDIHLAVSRDGISFERPSRRPYLGLGEDGQPDSRAMYMLAGIVRVGDAIHHYYSAWDITHGYYSANPEKRGVGAIAHATQRLDGFVSQTADEHGGWLQTPELVFQGNRLELNVATAVSGVCRVQIESADGPVAGYTLADCDPIRGNYVHRIVTWQGNADVGKLAGQAMRLRIELTNGDLYAFQVLSGE